MFDKNISIASTILFFCLSLITANANTITLKEVRHTDCDVPLWVVEYDHVESNWKLCLDSDDEGSLDVSVCTNIEMYGDDFFNTDFHHDGWFDDEISDDMEHALCLLSLGSEYYADLAIVTSIYYLGKYCAGTANTANDLILISEIHTNITVIAHEVGHLCGIGEHDPEVEGENFDPLRVMNINADGDEEHVVASEKSEFEGGIDK